MEYLRENTTRTTLDHYGIGSAHENDASTAHMAAVPKESLRWHFEGAEGGFNSFVVSKEAMTVRYHDGDGKIVFTAPNHPPRA
jgi:hypothetical protein